jgi:hypothetical protein
MKDIMKLCLPFTENGKAVFRVPLDGNKHGSFLWFWEESTVNLKYMSSSVINFDCNGSTCVKALAAYVAGLTIDDHA